MTMAFGESQIPELCTSSAIDAEVVGAAAPQLGLQALAAGEPADAFAWLGWHRNASGEPILRVLLPGALHVAARAEDSAAWTPMQATALPGIFEARLASAGHPAQLRIGWPDCEVYTHDAYGFGLLLDDSLLQQYSAGEPDATRALGAVAASCASVEGVRFAVWAPNARRVAVVGDFNGWNGQRHPMRLRHQAGV